MARIGGRSTWIAVPAGMLCAAVVASLVWLALPMFPVAASWVGDTLRTASAPRPIPAAMPDTRRSCRRRPAARLPRALPRQPVVGAHVARRRAAVADRRPARDVRHLARPTRWRRAPASRARGDSRAGGGIVTTLVGRRGRTPRPSPTPRCAGRDSRAPRPTPRCDCSASQGDVVEEHTVRGGLWLSSMETSWHPADYGARLEAKVWSSGPG